MEYIRHMRALVGHERILIPATALVILNDRDELVLHLRDDTHSWGLPGGLMNLGENLGESARREAREETGLELGALTFFGSFSGPAFYNRYPNGDLTAPLILGFFTRDYRGTLRPSEESRELAFFRVDRLPEPMHDRHRAMVEAYVAFARGGGREPVLS